MAKIPFFQVVNASRPAKPVKVLHISQAVIEYRHSPQGYKFRLEPKPISADQATATHALSDTLNLARRYTLSAYAAAYLELALRTGLPLATLDEGLVKAVTTAGVAILGTY